MQKQWDACEGRHETLRAETIGGCRAKLMTTGSVNNKRGVRAGVQSQVDQRGRKKNAGNAYPQPAKINISSCSRKLIKKTYNTLRVAQGIKLSSLESPLPAGAEACRL